MCPSTHYAHPKLALRVLTSLLQELRFPRNRRHPRHSLRAKILCSRLEGRAVIQRAERQCAEEILGLFLRAIASVQSGQYSGTVQSREGEEQEVIEGREGEKGEEVYRAYVHYTRTADCRTCRRTHDTNAARFPAYRAIPIYAPMYRQHAFTRSHHQHLTSLSPLFSSSTMLTP
jgi:hypothetical protein